jgi:hypothetical protein
VSEHEKRIRRLSAALAVLVAASALAWFLAEGRNRPVRGRLYEGATAAVARVELEDRGASITLEREGDLWIVVDGPLRLPARSSCVEELLAELRERRYLDVAARSEAARSRLGLAEGAARLRLADAGGAVLLELGIGDLGADGNSLFLYVAGFPESWSTDSALAGYLDARRGRWLELGLGGAPVRAEDATALEVRGSLTLDGNAGERFSAGYRLERGADGIWTVSGSSDFALDQGRVDSLVRMLLGLEADDIDGVAGGDGECDMTLSLEAGGALRQWRIKEIPGGFAVVTNLLPWRYIAGAARLRSVLASLGSLRAD